MKKKLYLLTALLLAFGFSANAQKQSMTVHKTDGTSVTYKSSEVLRVEFVDGTGAGTGTGTGETPGSGEGTGGGATGGTGSIDGHEYVDLGLPSGTLWATCNVGATTPEGFGDKFAWGETAPKDKYTEENYFDWVLGLTEDDEDNFPKYNDHGGLTTLLPEDDAATVNWGNSWCLPSYEQCKELTENCTCEKVLKNNIECLKVKSNLNGNYIYLPCTGTGSYWGNSALYLENRISYSSKVNSAMGIINNSDVLFYDTSGWRWASHSARAVVKQ